jgi:putative transposase
MTPRHRKQVKHYDEPGHCHELTFSCYRRMPLLTNNPWRTLFCQSIDRSLKRHQYQLYSFVLMPEHVHLLVQPSPDGSPVSSLLKAIKRPFSYRVKQRLIASKSPLLKKLTIRQRPGVMTFRFWQEGPGYDRNMTSPKAILFAIDYIHENPVRRGLCRRAVDWKWSSARHYLNSDDPGDPDLPRIHPLSLELFDEGTAM